MQLNKDDYSHNLVQMEPTLTLKVPFILLGRNELDEPSKIDNTTPSAYCVNLICQILREFCPNVPVLQDVDDWCYSDVPEGWRVRPGESDMSLDNHSMRARGLWGQSMLLERRSIPIDTKSQQWVVFEDEIKLVFEKLAEGCEGERPLPGKDYTGKWWSLYCLPDQYITFTLAPHASNVGGLGTLQLDTVQNLFMLVAGLERELAMFTTPSALLKFCPLSRFLEHLGLQEMSKEKRDMWRGLQDVGSNASKRRKGLMYSKEKSKWIQGFDDKETEHEKRRERRREWWDAIADMSADEFMNLVNHVVSFTSRGAGTCLSIGLHQAEVEAEQVSRKDSIAGSAEGKGDDGNHAVRSGAKIDSVAFHHYPAVLDYKELIAYTTIVANIGNIAFSLDSKALSIKLEKFRASLRTQLGDFCHGTEFLNMLSIDRPTQAFLREQLPLLFTSPDSSIANDRKPQTTPRIRQDPFYPLRKQAAEKMHRERQYMLTYVERYDRVGGFCPTRGWKLYALMQRAEYHGRKTQYQERIDNGNLDTLEDVKVGEAAAQAISRPKYKVMSRRHASHLPDLAEGEPVDKNSWIEHWDSNVVNATGIQVTGTNGRDMWRGMQHTGEYPD